MEEDGEEHPHGILGGQVRKRRGRIIRIGTRKTVWLHGVDRSPPDPMLKVARWLSGRMPDSRKFE